MHSHERRKILDFGDISFEYQSASTNKIISLTIFTDARSTHVRGRMPVA